jgi:hypothetical protein
MNECTNVRMGIPLYVKIVNVKVAFIRPQYTNLREWMSDTTNVYIGRKNIVFIDGIRFPPEDSPWANPFKIGKDGSREDCLKKYRNYVCKLLISDRSNVMITRLLGLRGKTLGCWCTPEPCHGDIIGEFIAYAVECNDSCI